MSAATPTLKYRIGDAADMRSFYRGRWRDAPVTIFVAEAEGVSVGIGGVYWDEAGRVIAFLDCKRRWMPPPLKATRMARDLFKAVVAAGETEILALPDPRIETARRWLGVIGFTFKDGSEVMTWQTR